MADGGPPLVGGPPCQSLRRVEEDRPGFASEAVFAYGGTGTKLPPTFWSAVSLYALVFPVEPALMG